MDKWDCWLTDHDDNEPDSVDIQSADAYWAAKEYADYAHHNRDMWESSDDFRVSVRKEGTEQIFIFEAGREAVPDFFPVEVK